MLSAAKVFSRAAPQRDLGQLQEKIPFKNQSPEGVPSGLSGAATQIRTGDLILTKDVLYQLSHSSKSQEYFLVTQIIIPNLYLFVNRFCESFQKK